MTSRSGATDPTGPCQTRMPVPWCCGKGRSLSSEFFVASSTRGCNKSRKIKDVRQSCVDAAGRFIRLFELPDLPFLVWWYKWPNRASAAWNLARQTKFPFCSAPKPGGRVTRFGVASR